MSKFLVFIFCLIAFVTPSQELASSVIVIENEVVYSIALPDWAYSCDEILVYSKPDLNSKIVKYLPANSKIRIRYGSKDNNFANIGIMEWVKTTNLCEAK